MADLIRWLFSFPRSRKETITHAAVCGVLLAFLLFGFVLATGQTFGQRCSAAYEKGTADWRACVHRLAEGGSLNG